MTHPMFLRLFELPDVDAAHRMAAFGFVSACATLSAAHLSDYVVSYGVAATVAHEATPLLLDICVRAGLMVEVDVDGTRMWRIPDDPEFLHMRTREEIEWERQRKADNANPELVIPVRLRDGDACRYCGQVVNWKARKGRLRGTYDHRRPGQAATVDTMVVACQGCNASRSNDPTADQRHPLLPAPTRPYFSDSTRDWITQHEWARANGYSIDTRRGRTLPPGTVPDDRRQTVTEHQAAHTAAAAPGSQPGPAPATPQPAGERGPRADPPPVGERAPRPPTRPADPQPAGGRDQADTTSSTSTTPPTAPHPAPGHPANPQPAGARDTEADRQPAGERPPTTPSPADPQPAGGRDEHPAPTTPQRTRLQREDAHTQHRPPPAPTRDLLKPADPAEGQSPTSGKSGSGRDGSGRFGSQTRVSASGAGRPSPSSSSSPARRRGRRRRSSRSRS